MSADKTPTPRTDAVMLEIHEGRTYTTIGPIANLARDLERENAALRADVVRLREGCETALICVEAVCFNTGSPAKRRSYADAASLIRSALHQSTLAASTLTEPQ